MSHTKLPWRVFDDHGDIEIRDTSSLLFSICDMRYAPGESGDGKWATEEANAAFIVKAANTHYELVAALEAMTNMWNSVCKANGHDPLHMTQYEDAIALLDKVRP